VGGVPIFFFYFHIWTTEVIPYNALISEFRNFETPCIKKYLLCFLFFSQFFFLFHQFFFHSTYPFPLVVDPCLCCSNLIDKAIFDFSSLYVFFYKLFYVLFNLLLTLSFTSTSSYHYVIFSSSPVFIFHFPFQPSYSLRHTVFFFVAFLFFILKFFPFSRFISLLVLSLRSSFVYFFISTSISFSFSSILSISLPAFFSSFGDFAVFLLVLKTSSSSPSCLSVLPFPILFLFFLSSWDVSKDGFYLLRS
jgi:hypothetical protein